ncbi:MAG: resuscitation-promoting factor RpfA [Acidimicrobiaceae bacterium]
MALQGTLDTFALPDVLRLLASTKKTGRLVIAGNRGTGSVWVDDGSVVGSEATGALPDAGAVDVIFELLRYADGSFTFESGTTTSDPAPSRAVEPLLVDAERQLAEWREIEAVVPSMDAWISLVGDLEGEEILIAAERWKTIVSIGSGTSVTGLGHTLKLGELDVCRQVKELVELGLVKVSATPVSGLRALDEVSFGADADAATPATWDPFSIEIPGVDPVAVADEETTEPELEPVADVVSIVEEDINDDDPIEADEVAKQLASLSPKAARAVAAAARAATDEERDAALAEASDEDDEPINRGLLLKFLSSVKS